MILPVFNSTFSKILTLCENLNCTKPFTLNVRRGEKRACTRRYAFIDIICSISKSGAEIEFPNSSSALTSVQTTVPLVFLVALSFLLVP